MRVEPYLMFAGRCEEALAFYWRAIDALARRFFDALAEVGNVLMPMQPTFWPPCFGMCSDRFGVQGMVGLDGPQT